MRTKLVYVLTCAPEKYYIEQALMSMFSARHWNPYAHIVLIVDDLTDKLLVGKRAELLDYVSEKIVVPFDDASLSMMYRSRFIKTSVRQLIQGRFLFIDCDTIVCGDLSEIDTFDCEIGAVWESHLPVRDYCKPLFEYDQSCTLKLGVDLETEGVYYSSGVILADDTGVAKKLFQLWHSCWEESTALGMGIDQPALAKANVMLGRVVQRIPDVYNCIVFTKNNFTRQAKILHISSYRNPSYLFSKKVLEYVRNNGLKNHWIVDSIMRPCASFLPFDFDILYSTRKQRKEWIKEIAYFSSGYGKTIDASFADFPMKSHLRLVVIVLLRGKCNLFAAWLWMLWRRIFVWRHRKTIKDNVCRK